MTQVHAPTLPPADLPQEFSGERISPMRVTEALFREHHMRYLFAGERTRGMALVDVACGTGMGTNLMARMGARWCCGMEIDVESVRYAARRYPGCRFAVCDATRLPVAPASVDCVVSLETLEHLGDPEGFVAQCARALKPGGRFIVSTPNRPVYRWLGKNPFHVREFTREEFLHLLSTHFAACELFGQGEVFYPVFVMRRIALNLLAQLRIKEHLRRMLKPPWAIPTQHSDFDPGLDFPECEVRPFVTHPLRRPLYFVAIATKA